MDTWTPPDTIGIVRQAGDADLFAHLGLESRDTQPADCWALTRGRLKNAPLSLVRPDGVAICVEFNTGKALHRANENGKGATAIAKALGVKQYFKAFGEYPVIVDATGGLGQDAWALASLGCTMYILERHSLVHALLADGLQRAAIDEKTTGIAARVTLIHDDAVRRLPSLVAAVDAHAIYLDPMYPARRKRASSKKGMQFLHSLLGPATVTESPELLRSALACGLSRVAVKRPKGAGLLAGSDGFNAQLTVIDTPNTRYDVYHQT